MKKLLILSTCFFLLFYSKSWALIGGGGERSSYETTSGVPLPAAKVGYTTNTLNSTFDGDYDLTDTESGRKNDKSWYLWNYFGSLAHSANITVTDGVSAVLNGELVGPNGNLVSAYVAGSTDTFKGTVYGGGGYFEATISFDPATVSACCSNGWPSWWLYSIEHVAYNNLTDLSAHWDGQAAGYSVYNETDILEYIYTGTKPDYYTATVHTHYGITDHVVSSSTNNGNLMAVPSKTMFTSPHKYGFLWVPATETTEGYGQYYFDQVAVGPRVTWTDFVALEESPPPSGTSKYGVIDDRHLVLILGTGPGAPMTVYNVQVWQKDATHNIHR